MKEVYIVAAKRTPIGGFLGALSHISATRLGAIAIQSALQSRQIQPEWIQSVYMGNVLSANLGQAPARQASKFAGLPDTVESTTINKVCSSGMKATTIGAQQIQLGLEDMVVTGGMENMSQVPHYKNLRCITKLGHEELTDGLLKDGLTDVYHQYHMGLAAELCVDTYHFSREQQDAYALQSYQRAKEATASGKFEQEIAPVPLSSKEDGEQLTRDEDIFKLKEEKVPSLPPAFKQGGTVTAANASNLNDGAAALVLASKEAVEKYRLKPLAKIIAYADAAQAPEWFTTSPSVAIQKLLSSVQMTIEDIDYFEINEAYAAVALANQQILNIPSGKLNIYGGAVAVGHPLGASGARIICTLLSVLRNEKGRNGIAAICNGGGGATAILIENLQ